MVAAELIDGRIAIASSWSEKELVKQIPGSGWDNDNKIWHAPLSWSTCVQLRGIFGQDLKIGSDLSQWAKDELSWRINPSNTLRDLKALTVPLTTQDPLYKALYDFQKVGAEFLHTADSALLTDEMGTGKTIQMLTTLRMKLAGKAPALVIVPNTVKGNWAKEAKKWYPEATPYVIAGTAVARRKTFVSAMADPSALVIINFESVRLHTNTAGFGSIALKRCAECGGQKDTKITAKQCEVHSKELNAIPFAAVVVDEAHRIKDGQAKQTRSVWAVGHQPSVEHRYAMTGTPIANNAADLWSLMHFVAPHEYPTKSKFVDRYCQVTFNSWGAMEIGGLNPATKEELFKFLNPRMRRTLKSEVLTQLPEKVFTTINVGMTKEQKKMYDQMAEGMITRLPDGAVMVAKDNLVVNTRLIQFSSASMVQTGTKIVKQTDSWGVEHEVEEPVYGMCEPCPKLDAMEDLLADMGDKPLVVAAVHKQLIDLAEVRLKKAGISYGKITGDVPQWERDLYVQQFQEGKLRVMLLTMAAGGVGITLTAADTMLRLQCSWSMVDNTQVVDRIHRIGAEIHQQVNIIDVVAAGTVEEDQVEKVHVKSLILKDVVQD